jgi:hypothetical protein
MIFLECSNYLLNTWRILQLHKVPPGLPGLPVQRVPRVLPDLPVQRDLKANEALKAPRGQVQNKRIFIN